MNRSGTRESGRKPPERQATINRREGVRSRYARCSRCKKLRMYVPYPNHHANEAWKPNGKFTDWRKMPDGSKVCFVCIERELKS